MSYRAFDPRIDIRNRIGTPYDIYDENKDRPCLLALDDYSDNVYIPMLTTGEARSGELPPMPFIEMTLVDSPSETHNISGNIKFQTSYIDFNIYYTATDNISATTFGETVADKIIDKITSYRNTTSGVTFYEVVNDGREIIESYNNGKLVVFHRVLSIKAVNYDNG